MIPRGAGNAGGGYKAAELLTNTPEQQALAGATGLAPATQSALASATPADATAALAARSALYTSGWLSPAPSATDGVFGAMIRDVITGRQVIQAALSTAERSLGAALEP